MKARVKLTGQIVDVVVKEIPQYRFLGESTGPIEYSITRFYDGEHYYRYDELDFEVEPFDYWTRLEHQAAIAAMQGLVNRGEVLGSSVQEIARDIAEISCEIAHALVEKMKEERK